jgi:hypothetical protein
MATVEKFLGDPYETREAAVEKMIDFIGRDASDLDFTIAGGTDGADIEFTDPDVRLAWHALAEVYAQVMTKFWFFNTIEEQTIAINGSGEYVLPDQFGQDDARMPNTSGVAAVRVTEQPTSLDLIFREETGTTQIKLFDRLSNTNTGFTTGDIKVEIAYFLNWDVIPFFVRNFIVLEAGLKFAKRATASADIIQLITEDRDRARVLMTGNELESRAPNMLIDGALTLPGITDRFPF